MTVKTKAFLVLCSFILLASCTKDWNCECEYTDGNTTWTTNSTIEDASKTDAESECNDSGSLGNSSYSCEIK